MNVAAWGLRLEVETGDVDGNEGGVEVYEAGAVEERAVSTTGAVFRSEGGK
jgi:hypothetical protein